jgi:sterol desaturase/sphingolipid hydroxylase (fatty acid hydroxylase superfamily)
MITTFFITLGKLSRSLDSEIEMFKIPNTFVFNNQQRIRILMTRINDFWWQYFNLTGSMLLLLAIFYLMEMLTPAERGQPLSKRLFNVAYMMLFMVVLLCITQPLAGLCYSVVLMFIGGSLMPQLINERSGFGEHVLFALFFALVTDLWQYTVHRLQHSVPFLWETHKFHHTETALNASTQGRVHFSQHILYLVSYLPVFLLFGSQSVHFIAAFIMFRLWGVFNHANLRLNFGLFTPLLSSPQWHRIHHSIEPEHRNKNFAAFFPFIDIIFGSYYHPQKDEYPPTGVIEDTTESDLWEATFSPLIKWREMVTAGYRIRKHQSSSNKFS